MPTLSQCAAAVPLNRKSGLDGLQSRSPKKEERQSSVMEYYPLLTATLSKKQYQISPRNPLLERFIAEQPDLISVPCLRRDLQYIRRLGCPSISSSWTESCNGEESTPTQEKITKQIFAELPGLSLANFKWASSAIRQMGIEAIFI